MDIIIVSTVFTALSWCVAVFSLYSVIHLNFIEKSINQYLTTKNCDKNYDVSTVLESLRDRYQTAFYWSAGAGVVFYIWPEIVV